MSTWKKIGGKVLWGTCFLLPLLALLKHSAENHFFNEEVRSISPTYVSEKVCNQEVCFLKYEFKLDEIAETFKNPSIGFHSAFVDSTLAIGERPPLQSFESAADLKSTWFDFHRFQISPSDFTENIYVYTYSPRESRKIGLGQGKIYLGETLHVKAMEYWWNFFSVYLYVFSGFVCLVVGLIITWSGQTESRSASLSSLLIFFSLLGLSHSLDNLLYSLGVSHDLLTASVRLAYLTSILRLSEVILEKKLTWLHWLLVVGFSSTVVSEEVSNFILHGAYRWMVLSASISLAIVLVKKRAITLLPILFYFLWDSLLIFNLLPSSLGLYLSPFAIALLFVMVNFKGVKGVIRNHVSWMKKEALTNELKKFKYVDLSRQKLELLLGQLVESLMYNVGCGKASICFFEDNLPVVVHLANGRKQLFSDGIMPKVFGRVIQTGESLWWKDDSHFDSLIDGKRTDYSSVSTIIPITLDSKTYGAIALSNFHEEKAKLLESEDEIKSILNSYLDLISRYLLYQKTTNEAEVHQVGLNLSDNLSSKLFKCHEPDEVYSSLADVMSQEMNSVAMVFKYDHKSRGLSLKGFGGHAKYVYDEWNKVPFKARENNKTSPFAVAINEKKTVFIANIESYYTILQSKHSQRLFELTGTKGFFCTPIQVEGEVDSLLVLLERDSAICFSSNLTRTTSASLSYAAFKLKEIAIERRELQKDELLNQFVPRKAKDKILAGEDAFEKDYGLMIMVDLSSSTKISNEGTKYADRFVDCVETVRSEIEPFGHRFGYKLQKINWDAFYFTLSYAENETFSQSDLEEFVEFVYKVCIQTYSEYFDDLEISPHQSGKSCCRVVFAEGDISRSMINVGKTHSWGIHGTIMAVICKLEDACKKIEGYFFTLGSMVSKHELNSWEDTGVEVESTDDKIFRLELNKQKNAA